MTGTIIARAAAAVLCTSLAQLVQALFAPAPIPADFFWAHGFVVLCFQLLAALTLGFLPDGRAWAAAVFVFPVSTALLWTPSLAPAELVAGLFLVGLGVAWVARGPAEPVVAAGAGAFTGCAVLAVRHGLEIDPSSAAGLATQIAMAAIMSVGVWVAAGRLSVGIPRPAASLALAIAVTAVGGLASMRTGLPSPPANVSCGGSASSPVLVVVLDTVRADHLELFGYDRETMPRLAHFAAQPGVRAARSVSNAASSLPSHASMFTGLYPPHHGAHKPFLDDLDPPVYEYPLGDDMPTLAELMGEAGYWTVGVTANFGPLSPARGLARGFHAYDATPGRALEESSPWTPAAWARGWLGRVWRTIEGLPPFADSELLARVSYRRAERITDAALNVMDASGDCSLFLFLNYFDAHRPYAPPRRFRGRFAGYSPSLHGGGLSRETEQAVLSGSRDLTSAERDHLTAMYDGELAYLDQQLGRLLDALQGHPAYADTLILITSDHGEALGERRHLEHSTSLYDDVVAVPLVIKSPSGKAPTLPAGLFQSADVFPTVLEHAGIPLPADIDGTAWARGRRHAFSWLYPHRVVQKWERFNRELISAQNERWKLIRASTGERELLRVGRGEDVHTDVSALHPDQLESLEHQIESLAAEARARPGVREEMSLETEQRLRTLGYIE